MALAEWWEDHQNVELRCYVAQHASPLLLAYWLGWSLQEVESDPVSAVDEAAPMLFNLLHRPGMLPFVQVAEMQGA